MLGKIAVIVTFVGTLLGIFGAVRAQQYGKINRAYLYDRSRSSTISARRDELRGTCQGLAVGCIAAAIAGGALAFVAKKKEGELPMRAVSGAVISLGAAIFILSHDVF